MELIKKTQAETLPKGWKWTDCADGSGSLSSPEGVVYYSYDMNERTYDGGISYTTKDGGGYSFTDTLEAFKSYAEQSINLITSKEVAPVEENAKSIKRYTSVTKEGRAVLVLENASVSTDEMVDKWNTIHWPNGSCTVYGDAINKFKALEDAEAAHNEKIKELLSLYEGNKEDLKTISQHIQEHGCLENGLSDVSDTFEQGYNNALERVFHVLGVRY